MAIFIFLLVVIGVWLAFGRKAAGKTILITILLAFVVFVGFIIWVMTAYPSHPTINSTIQPAQTQSDETAPMNTPSNTAAPTSIRVTTFYNGGANGGTSIGYSLSIPIFGSFTQQGSSASTCTWTWDGGNNGVPYSQTTYAQAGSAHTIPYATYSDGGDNFYNFKVNCVDNLGNQYIGIFPSP